MSASQHRSLAKADIKRRTCLYWAKGLACPHKKQGKECRFLHADNGSNTKQDKYRMQECYLRSMGAILSALAEKPSHNSSGVYTQYKNFTN